MGKNPTQRTPQSIETKKTFALIFEFFNAQLAKHEIIQKVEKIKIFSIVQST